MRKIHIFLVGCDDTTEIEMEVTEEQYEFLNIIAKKSKEASSYSCMPIMEINY